MATAPEPRPVDAPADDTLTFKIDDTLYSFRPGDMTASLELELFKATGCTFTEIGGLLKPGKVALFAGAALVWLARRQTGERVEFDMVAQSITPETPVEVVGDAAPEV